MKRRRNHTLSVRISLVEHEHLCHLAAEQGQTVSAALRTCIQEAWRAAEERHVEAARIEQLFEEQAAAPKRPPCRLFEL